MPYKISPQANSSRRPKKIRDDPEEWREKNGGCGQHSHDQSQRCVRDAERLGHRGQGRLDEIHAHNQRHAGRVNEAERAAPFRRQIAEAEH